MPCSFCFCSFGLDGERLCDTSKAFCCAYAVCSCQQTMCYASPALRADQHNESTVQRLLWLPAFSPEQCEAAAAIVAQASAALLGHGGHSSSAAAHDAPADQPGDQPGASSASHPSRLGHQLQHARKLDNDGSGIPLMVVPSQVSVTSDLPPSELSSQQRLLPHQHETPSKCPFPSSSGQCLGRGAAGPLQHSADDSEDGRGSENDDEGSSDEDNVLVKYKEAPRALLLLVAGGDGLVQVWSIGQLAQATLLCCLPGQQGHAVG